MKIKKLVLENVKSFKDRTEIELDRNINIFIGPNAGGKSNLLDIISIVLRHYFIKYYEEHKDRHTSIIYNDIHREELFNPINKHLEKYNGNEANDLFIEVVFLMEKEDLDNIKEIVKFEDELNASLKQYRNKPMEELSFINIFSKLISDNEEDSFECKFKINNWNLTYGDDARENVAYNYLQYFELVLLLGIGIEGFNLSPLYIHFTPYRMLSGENLIATLTGEYYSNFNNLKKQYLQSTSRSTSSLVRIATSELASIHRNLELQEVNHKDAFYENSKVKNIREYFNKIGYRWDIDCLDSMSNTYQANLSKGEWLFPLDQASSGEREIVNFLMGLFSFNIEGGLIVIDEPELHLHPKWQNVLIELFYELSDKFGNQFIIVSHSPVFVNERTIENVNRIYIENNSSKIAKPNRGELPKAKDLVHIVNSLNNEKIFFADKVILVEGIDDRILLQELIKKELSKIKGVIDILEVHGKLNFPKYREFLNLFGIDNSIMADLDYIFDIVDGSIKNMFVADNSKIDKDVVQNEKSEDGNTLFEQITKNIQDCNEHSLSNLKDLTDYIQSRYKKLKSDLSKDEIMLLHQKIDELKNQGIYILKYGKIEDYFKPHLKGKGPDNVLAFIKSEEYNKWYRESDDEKRSDINLIIESVIRLSSKDND